MTHQRGPKPGAPRNTFGDLYRHAVLAGEICACRTELALTSQATPRHLMLHHLRALRRPLGLGWRRFASKNAHLMLSGEQPLKQAVLAHVQALVAQHEDVSSRMLSEGYSAARSKELTRLTPIVEAHAELLAAQQDVDGASELLSDPSSEPELVELAREELAEGERVLVERRKRLISLLVPPDETSAQEGVIIEEHAGVGEPEP